MTKTPHHHTRAWLIVLVLFWQVAVSLSIAADTSDRFVGTVLFMRHALAPGFGDPDHFSVTDCSTQRNLDETGRAQARPIGAKLAKADIKFSAVYSSYWCRCYNTVKSMGLKNYQLHSGLNSFYQNHVSKKEVMKDLRNLISSLDKKQGPYLFVTHYVVIGSYTKIFPDSGGIVVHDLNFKSNHELQLF